jgi:hypothetical protein
MTPLVRLGAAGLALCASLGVLSACTSDNASVDGTGAPGPYRLVAFDSCAQALTGLRTAAKSAVGPSGFMFSGAWARGGAPESMTVPQAKAGAGQAMQDSPPTDASGPKYSGTNTHEVGVDEPDLVKTDGRRIVTVTGNTLTVVDAVSKTVTGSLTLGATTGGFQYQPGELLLSGDHALLLMRSPNPAAFEGVVTNQAVPPAVNGSTDFQPKIGGPRLMLVSLIGHPRLLSSVTADGTLLDARQVGSIARVVLRSSPRFSFPYVENVTDQQRVAVNRSIIDQAPLDLWLPWIETTTGDSTQQVRIDCSAISRPASYTGASLLTVLSFDLGATSLADGQPTTLVADGETVYSNGASLYVTNNQQASVDPTAVAAPATTDIYKFDMSTGPRPTFVAGGSVPGYLLNQYAMSEWNGALRVATTTPAGPGRASKSASGIYLLAPDGRALKQVGSVVGLGQGEQIYAVRFVGPTGYVVTFRQTDPLYTVDLREPTRPAVRGVLKIPGYSAYLHPAGESQLIGVGQNATNQGRTTGTQVSLFDISDLADPTRVARYSLSGAHSEAEFAPHAFLYWPPTGLLVIPLQVYSPIASRPAIGAVGDRPEVGALVLRVTGQTIREVGFVQHSGSNLTNGYLAQIRR